MRVWVWVKVTVMVVRMRMRGEGEVEVERGGEGKSDGEEYHVAILCFLVSQRIRLVRFLLIFRRRGKDGQ